MSHGSNSKSTEVAENLSVEFNTHSIRFYKGQIILLRNKSQDQFSLSCEAAYYLAIYPNFCKQICLFIYSSFIFYSIIFSLWKVPSKIIQCLLPRMLFCDCSSESYGKGLIYPVEWLEKKNNEFGYGFDLFF